MDFKTLPHAQRHHVKTKAKFLKKASAFEIVSNKYDYNSGNINFHLVVICCKICNIQQHFHPQSYSWPTALDQLNVSRIFASTELLTIWRKSRDVESFKSQLSLSRMQRSIRRTSATEHPHSLLRTNVSVSGMTYAWRPDICTLTTEQYPHKLRTDTFDPYSSEHLSYR